MLSSAARRDRRTANLVVCLCALAIACTAARTPPVPRGPLAGLGVDVTELASPAMDGRAVGTAGGDLAIGYVATAFAEIGLVPPPGTSGFLQRFSILGAPTDYPVMRIAGLGESAVELGDVPWLLSPAGPSTRFETVAPGDQQELGRNNDRLQQLERGPALGSCAVQCRSSCARRSRSRSQDRPAHERHDANSRRVGEERIALKNALSLPRWIPLSGESAART